MPGTVHEDDGGFGRGHAGGLGDAVMDAAQGTRVFAGGFFEISGAVVTGPSCWSVEIEEFRGVDIDCGKTGRWLELWRRHNC